MIEKISLPLNIQGIDVALSAIQRPDYFYQQQKFQQQGLQQKTPQQKANSSHYTKAPILFLHGFGSTKEDYADIVFHKGFQGHPFIAYDAPGCGETVCTKNEEPDSVETLRHICIPFLVDNALAVLDAYKVDKFHLVGHSMGGLTALMLAHQCPDRVLSFVDIEGNIAPEDCFLSRQIISHDVDDADVFFDAFIERTRHSPAYSSALYAASLKHKVRAAAVRGIFESMVDLSDNAQLMDKFLGLPCPKTFMYGEQNAHLSYLSHIESQGVNLAEIKHCGHFPMYSNPLEMWDAIYQTQSQVK